MLLERVICGNCTVPMRCTKTSVPVMYNEAVVYFGTEFTCPECGQKTIPITSEEGMCASKFFHTDDSIEVND